MVVIVRHVAGGGHGHARVIGPLMSTVVVVVFVLMGPWGGWAMTLMAVVVLAGCHRCRHHRHHHVGGGCGGQWQG